VGIDHLAAVRVRLPRPEPLTATLEDHDVDATVGQLGCHHGTCRPRADDADIGRHADPWRDPTSIDQHGYRA
jgi:hypothetical protein